MLISTMTNDEMLKELNGDYFNCLKYIEKNFNKFRRSIMRRSIFPIRFTPIRYTSVNKNKFLIFVSALSRKDMNTPHIGIVNYFLTPKGMSGILLLPNSSYNKVKIIIFSPHFFKRYNERFLKSNDGILDVMTSYFQRNDITSSLNGDVFENNVEENEVFKFINDGVVFTDVVSENIMIMKTFVNKELFYQRQKELFDVGIKISENKIKQKEINYFWDE